jgi:RND family efflux transporter MFP subunit
MTKKRMITIISVIAVVLLLIKGKGLLDVRKDQVSNETLPEKALVTVPVVTVKKGTLEYRVPFLAQILADKGIQLSTKLAGYVEKVFVEESQKVKKGEVLVQIDSIEIRSNLDALQSILKAQESDLALVKNIYMRNQKLYAIGGLSQEQLESSHVALRLKSSSLESTRQKITQLKHQLSYLKIVAPFDGEIDRILLHEGDLAAVGKPILSMSNGKKKLVFSYTPSQQAMIKKEQDVFVNDQQVGYVKAIYTTSQNGLVSAEVMLNKEIGQPTGSSLNMEVLIQKKTGCILPDTTLVHKKTGTFVMVYENGKFTPLKVELKMQDGNSILVSPCPKAAVAQASEVKLAQLPAYDNVAIRGEK